MSEITFDTLNNSFTIAISKEHRPVTDAILLSAFANVKKNNVCCDFCSGCGIIPFLWYANKRNPLLTYAVEIQALPYEQMKITVNENNLGEAFFPINKDLNELNGEIRHNTVDVITCNPPYKIGGTGIRCDSEDRQIARHEEFCTLDDIFKVAYKLMKPGAKICMCHRPERTADIMESMRKFKIEPKRLRYVQKKSDTAPWLVLIEGRKNQKPFLQVEAPLITRDENGEISDEIKQIYNSGIMNINISR